MASIYSFPMHTPEEERTGTAHTEDDIRPSRPAGVPDEVWHAVESVRVMRRLDGVDYREIPVPSASADYGIGVELECAERDGTGVRVASGWIMILYAGVTRSGWWSRWRCVAFASLPLEEGGDCLTASMYWEDMADVLSGVDPSHLKGTVTVTQNTSFGGMEAEPHTGCEMRVSWTPAEPPEGVDAGAQVMAWARFLRASLRNGERETIE